MDSDNTLAGEYNVKWPNHHSSLVKLMEKLLVDETFADCSLAADGIEIAAHKLILSASSPFLNALLRKHREKHAVIVLRDVTSHDLQSIIEYIYKGEVQLPQHRLSSFLKAAENLQLIGISPSVDDDESLDTRELRNENTSLVPEEPEEKVDSEEGFAEELIEYLSENSEENVEVLDEDSRWLMVDDEEESTDCPMNAILATENTENAITSIPLEVVAKIPSVPLNEESIVNSLIKLRSSGDDFTFNCTRCNGHYKTQATFENHLRHDCNQYHSCPRCHKVFKNKRHLLDHVRDDCGRVHVCPRCKRSFKQKVNLTTHQKHYCKPQMSGLHRTNKK